MISVGLFAVCSVVAAADNPAPWLDNAPIVTVQKSLFKEHPREGTGAIVSVQYVGPGLERMETHVVEYRDDVHNERSQRLSRDNGRTWSEFQPIPSTDVYYEGKELWEGGGATFYDETSGLLVQVWLRQIAIDGIYNCFTYVRTSNDFGMTWSEPLQLRYEPGVDFDPKNPHGEEFLRTNQAYIGSNIIRTRDGKLLTCVAHANADGDPDNAKRPWKMGSVCFIGTWNADSRGYTWEAGARVQVSPEMSARGLMEPEVAELRDGRILVVWRGSNKGWDGTVAKIPGRKFYSISTDGGRTLSPVAEWKYSDGSSFYSPSSYHRMIRHSQTGKLYWVGNITPVPPDGNSPRYPLVIAEVDETSGLLEKDTVTAIDDRREGQPEALQFSNFSLIEDRESHDLELYMTLYGERAESVYAADCYRYVCEVVR